MFDILKKQKELSKQVEKKHFRQGAACTKGILEILPCDFYEWLNFFYNKNYFIANNTHIDF